MKQTSIDPARTELIRVKAYEIWLGKGCPHGSAEQDWVQAEHEVAALLDATAANETESDANASARSQADIPESEVRPEGRTRQPDASVDVPAAPPTVKSPGSTRAGAKNRRTASRGTAPQKTEPKKEQKAEQKSTHAPPTSAPRTAAQAEGHAKGPAKARGRGRAAATGDAVSSMPPASAPKHPASAGSSHPAMHTGEAPASGPVPRQAGSTRSGSHRAAATPATARQRKG